MDEILKIIRPVPSYLYDLKKKKQSMSLGNPSVISIRALNLAVYNK